MPLLLQLLFWYIAVLKALPGARDSVALPGRHLPQQSRPVPARARSAASGFGYVTVAARRRHRRGRSFSRAGPGAARIATGQQSPGRPRRARPRSLGLPLLVFVVAGAAADLRLSRAAARFNFSGGMRGPARVRGAAARPVASTPAAFIAEIVRAGILAVSHGQTEAASRSGLRPGMTLRLGRHPAGAARHHPAADQPVSQPDQELVARGGHRLSRSRAACSPARCSTRPGRRSRSSRITMAVYLTISLVTSLLHELVQPAHGAGGAVRAHDRDRTPRTYVRRDEVARRSRGRRRRRRPWSARSAWMREQPVHRAVSTSSLTLVGAGAVSCGSCRR